MGFRPYCRKTSEKMHGYRKTISEFYTTFSNSPGEDYRRFECDAKLKTEPTLSRTDIPVKQRRSIGQVRRKQGEQGTPARIRTCRGSPGVPGAVNAGEVLP